jgi:hypothetical protein
MSELKLRPPIAMTCEADTQAEACATGHGKCHRNLYRRRKCGPVAERRKTFAMPDWELGSTG